MLMVPMLSGYIAYSIADRPGLAPGLIGGLLALLQLQAGFREVLSQVFLLAISRFLLQNSNFLQV